MGLKQLKEKQAEKKSTVTRTKKTPAAAPVTKRKTEPKLSQRAKEVIAQAQTTAEVQAVLDSELPKGYHAIGKNDLAMLMALKQNIIQAGLTAFDYETNGDPDDKTQDTQDHEVVGVSFSFQVGQAFYMPIQHIGYGANWEMKWFVEHFLKPILEDPNILIIAHNIQAEHGWSLLYGIDMLPKTKLRKVVDTMIIIKMLQPKELIYFDGKDYKIYLGLKPATKALLADEKGWVHGLLHVDDIQSFKDTVGKVEWDEPTGEFYKSGANKGKPKTKKMSRHRTFPELPVDKKTVDYGCSDSDWALALYLKLFPILEAEDLVDTFFELNMPFSMVLAEYELTGWHVSRERLHDMERVAHEALYGANGTEEDPEEGSIAYKLDEALRELLGIYDGDVIVPAGTYGMGDWRGEPVSLEIKSSKPFS